MISLAGAIALAIAILFFELWGDMFKGVQGIFPTLDEFVIAPEPKEDERWSP